MSPPAAALAALLLGCWPRHGTAGDHDARPTCRRPDWPLQAPGPRQAPIKTPREMLSLLGTCLSQYGNNVGVSFFCRRTEGGSAPVASAIDICTFGE